MIVGWDGNNGSTLTAGLIAKKQNLKWRNKNGDHRVEFLVSLSQFGSVYIGYDINGKPHSKLFTPFLSYKMGVSRIIHDNNITLKMTRIRYEPVKRLVRILT